MNHPSWFVCTIAFFYWCFPALLQYVHQFDTQSRKQVCVVCARSPRAAAAAAAAAAARLPTPTGS